MSSGCAASLNGPNSGRIQGGSPTRQRTDPGAREAGGGRRKAEGGELSARGEGLNFPRCARGPASACAWPAGETRVASADLRVQLKVAAADRPFCRCSLRIVSCGADATAMITTKPLPAPPRPAGRHREEQGSGRARLERFVVKLVRSPTSRLTNARRLSALVVGLLVCGVGVRLVGVRDDRPAGRPRPGGGLRGHQRNDVANLNDTTVRGDIGAASQPSGFPPGVIVGKLHNGSADATAYADMQTAYTEAQGQHGRHRASGADHRHDTDPGPLHRRGRRRHPGGDQRDPGRTAGPNAVFVIQVNGALSLGARSEGQAHRRAAGVQRVLGGQRRLFDGRQRAVRRDGSGHDHRHRRHRLSGQRPGARSDRGHAWTPTSSTAPRRR